MVFGWGGKACLRSSSVNVLAAFMCEKARTLWYKMITQTQSEDTGQRTDHCKDSPRRLIVFQ
eukprot:scaffold10199_cov146-Cylindrotheca_fusiformis.AAC.14